MRNPAFGIPSSLIFFFFSSRRRHTRYIGDWSSDVCSSDLGEITLASPGCSYTLDTATLEGPCEMYGIQIGRASCRERVYISVVAAPLKKNARGMVYELESKTIRTPRVIPELVHCALGLLVI